MTLLFANIIGAKNFYIKLLNIGNFILALLFLNGCSSIPTSAQPSKIQDGHSELSNRKVTNANLTHSPGNGISVYIDPQTGEFIPEPREGQEVLKITPEMQNATSTSSEGLVEEISPVPGGGVMIDLKGRFQSPLIVTQDPSGKQKTRHLNDLPQYAPQPSTHKDSGGLSREQK